jgi:hypothetical protein
MSKKFDHNYCLRPARQPGSFAKNVCFALPHLAHHSKAKSLAFSFCPLYACLPVYLPKACLPAVGMAGRLRPLKNFIIG